MHPSTCAGGCFSMGKKQLALATFQILIFKYSPFSSIFPPLLFVTYINEELWVWEEKVSHPHNVRNDIDFSHCMSMKVFHCTEEFLCCLTLNRGRQFGKCDAAPSLKLEAVESVWLWNLNRLPSLNGSLVSIEQMVFSAFLSHLMMLYLWQQIQKN